MGTMLKSPGSHSDNYNRKYHDNGIDYSFFSTILSVIIKYTDSL